MSDHFSTFDGVTEPTEGKHFGNSLMLVLFEMAVYLILLWGLFTIVSCPPMHVS